MQSVSSRIWTCVAVSIFYDDNHYSITPRAPPKVMLLLKHFQPDLLGLEYTNYIPCFGLKTTLQKGTCPAYATKLHVMVRL